MTMRALQWIVTTISLISALTGASPLLGSDDVVHPQVIGNHDDQPASFIITNHPSFEEENEDSLAKDIENLRKLDALIGRAELAAMSNEEELDIDDDLPEIEEKLKNIDGVELVNPEDQFLDVADDLRHRPKEFSIIALPYNFAKYDSDSDGFITPSELARLTETKLRDSLTPFERADSNGDGFLTPEEFYQAPWKFDLEQEEN